MLGHLTGPLITGHPIKNLGNNPAPDFITGYSQNTLADLFRPAVLGVIDPLFKAFGLNPIDRGECRLIVFHELVVSAGQYLIMGPLDIGLGLTGLRYKTRGYH